MENADQRSEVRDVSETLAIESEPTMTERAIEDSDRITAPEQSPLQKAMDPPVEPVLYDADAAQRIPFDKEFDGETVLVTYILDAQRFDSLIHYDVLRNVRYESVDAKEAGERGAMAMKDRARDAALWLFNDRVLAVEGFGSEGEAPPPDWLSRIDDDDKQDVIDQAYLAVAEVPKPPAKPGKRIPWDYKARSGEKTIKIRALYGGYEVVLTHTRHVSPSAEQMSEFDSLKKQMAIVGGKQLNKSELLAFSKLRRYCELYDQLQYETTGYQGRVPPHHKMKVIEFDFAGTQQAVSKKPGDSPS